MSDIKHFLRIRTNPEAIFNALTTAEGIQGWWTQGAGKNGQEWDLLFGPEMKMQLDILTEEPNLISWAGKDDWNHTTVAFKLQKEEEGTTILRFSHIGWPPHTDDELLANINYNWGRFLYSLKTFVETGSGFPVVLE